jgi:hypothetical protein
VTAPDAQLPLCFVLMPFGVKADGAGRRVDFDSIYQDAIRPAIVDARMEPLRADEERDGGIVHKPMLERLVLCSFAVADLTLANANVFYELGVRHAVRPYTTVLLFEQGGQRLPFDVAPLRAIPYKIDASGRLLDSHSLRGAITDRLDAARDPAPDSPLYQLLEGFGPPDIARLKTDVFRDRVRYSEEVKQRLAAARGAADARAAVVGEHDALRPLVDQDAAIAIDLLLSYRAVSDYTSMIAVVDEMALPVSASGLVQEQLAFALNRTGRGDEAERVLLDLLDKQGPSSETLGLLGRVYKDRWSAATAAASPAASALLAKAIDAYRRGFEADWRDAYPGVNAVTLLELQSPGQQAVAELAPVVRYASLRRAGQAIADYWDYATLLELAVIARDDADAAVRLGQALAEAMEPWQRESTAANLALIAEAREAVGEDTDALRGLVADLER